jgi:hypothetical protein
MVPLKAVAAPMGEEPATTTIPAALVQYTPPPCRQPVPLTLREIVEAAVSDPERVLETPPALMAGMVSGLPGIVMVWAEQQAARTSNDTMPIARKVNLLFS